MKILEDPNTCFKNKKFLAKQPANVDHKRKGTLKEYSKYIRDTVLKGRVFPLFIDPKNLLSIEEVIHFCMKNYYVVKLFKHWNCFKTVVLISLL